MYRLHLYKCPESFIFRLICLKKVVDHFVRYDVDELNSFPPLMLSEKNHAFVSGIQRHDISDRVLIAITVYSSGPFSLLQIISSLTPA